MQDGSQGWEERSFAELYDEYFAKVNRYLRTRVSNYWDADDLTTAVFIKALEHFRSYDRSRPFGSWIFRIAHNTYVDYVKKRKEIPIQHQKWMAAEEDETWQPEKTALNKEQSHRLKDLLERLTPDQRDVLMLRFFADLKMGQIAEVIGKSDSAIKMITKRALSRLKTWFEGGNEA